GAPGHRPAAPLDRPAAHEDHDPDPLSTAVPGRDGSDERTTTAAAGRPGPSAPHRPGTGSSLTAGPRPAVTASEEDDSFTLDELMARSGLDKAQVDELTRFGLIGPVSSSGGERYYDDDAVAIATVSAGFARHGVEARHLRGWRTSAEREVSLFEQVVVPLLRQRNPQARTQAAITLDELAELGASLRQVLVRRAVREVH
ncbi:MAG: chaperone modulator CbpM, partial [Actinomycetota bacterium]|nr:chaperone modulator CbpM [Actinomycetota bacterium]